MPIRSRPFMLRIAFASVLAATLFSSGPAWAQPSNRSFTSSTSRTPDTFVDTVLPGQRIDTYQTRLLGMLQGDGTLYYDETFAVPFANPLVTAGVASAMARLTSENDGDPLTFLGPTLLTSNEGLLSSDTLATQIGDPTVALTVQTAVAVGPDTVLVGDRGLCAGFGADGYVFGCSGGTPFLVVAGSTNVNTNTNSQFQFTRTIQTTDRYEVFETWQLVGVPQTQPPVAVPAPGSVALVVLGLVGLLSAGVRRARRRH
jgi:hypothetical protein